MLVIHNLYYRVHPALHEMIEQSYHNTIGTQNILKKVLTDEKYKCLFDSPFYKDKYGMKACERLAVCNTLRDRPEFRKWVEENIGIVPYRSGCYSLAINGPIEKDLYWPSMT